MEIMSQDSTHRMQIGEIAVVLNSIVLQPDWRESHPRHEIIGLSLGDKWPGDIHLDMRLGNHRSNLLVHAIDGESFESVGCFWKKNHMQAHSKQIVPQTAVVHTSIEPLEPTPGFLIVEDLVLGTSPLSLGFPPSEECGLVNHMATTLGPFAKRLPAFAIDRRETAQLPDAVRELWDFR